MVKIKCSVSSVSHDIINIWFCLGALPAIKSSDGMKTQTFDNNIPGQIFYNSDNEHWVSGSRAFTWRIEKKYNG